MRDAASLDLVNSLEKRPEWSIMGGKDHFLVAGRITWDFRRASDEETDWGNKLLFLPAAKNMSMLVKDGKAGGNPSSEDHSLSEKAGEVPAMGRREVGANRSESMANYSGGLSSTCL
ncbi:hypothetical protein RJ639_008750 [Escallonia herrerae]|uniref:Exostosin GT47 domain-containing protein n=1 Tax=Escallonia herrerae TaxID=1293975 RepID=A0AA88VQQ3_9ASTE|nr:hypothetical protein RJ639_008750 [Escallonia herrerae]